MSSVAAKPRAISTAPRAPRPLFRRARTQLRALPSRRDEIDGSVGRPESWADDGSGQHDGGVTQLGLVTVLFTDLVESTALSTALGPEAADGFRRAHFQSLRDAVNAHRGSEVKNLGDGLMVTFDRPSDGAACAVEMQRQTARLGRRHQDLTVAIRVGLSVGEATREDDDWFGVPVVEAARLCAVAKPGEILATDLVRALSSSGGSVDFEDRGVLELKGLADAVAVVAVGWDVEAAGSDLPAPLAGAGGGLFVGREMEFDRLRTAWKVSLDGRRQAVLVAGEPGIGKTRLAQELAAVARAEGGTILYGRCDEEFGLTYQPFVEALDRYLAVCSRQVIDGHVARWGGELSRIVPEFGRRAPAAPAPVGADAEAERYRLFEAVADVLEAADEGGGVVLVLDDLHWADNGTLLLLRHLLRSDQAKRLLMIGTYRDTDLGRAHPLAEMLADLRRAENVERLALGGLDSTGVEAFVEAAAGQRLDSAGVALAGALHEETDGNPFFVGQVLRHLAETGAIYEHDGRWTFDGDVAHLGIPEGVREVIGRRLTRLSDRANVVLRTAAAIGRQFELSLVAGVAELSDEEVLDALDEAVLVRLVIETPGQVDRFSFTHALVRESLYGELSTSRRVRIHKRIGTLLEQRADAPLAALAHHFCEAAATGEVDKAAMYALRAGEEAALSLAPEDAIAHFSRGLEVLDAAGSAGSPARVDLLLGLSQVTHMGGQLDEARSIGLNAAELARRLDDGNRFARAVLATLVGAPRIVIDDASEQLLKEALSRVGVGDSALRSKLLGALSTGPSVAWGRDPDRRLALSEEALNIARRVGEDDALLWALIDRHSAIWGPENLEERLDLADEMTAHESGAYIGTGQVYRMAELYELGDIEGARSALATYAGHQVQVRWSAAITWSRVWDTSFLLFNGRLAEAEAELMAWFGDHGGVTEDLAFQAFGVQFFDLRRSQGRCDELLIPTQAIAEQRPEVVGWKAALALVHCELDQRDEASLIFDAIATDGFAGVFDNRFLLAMNAALLAEACFYLGDGDRAQQLYETLVPYAGRNIVIGGALASIGAASRYTALLAATMECWDDARAHFEDAIAMNERMGARPWLARSAVDYATMLRRCDSPGSERANELLALAASLADDIGMSVLRRRIDAMRTS